MRVTDFTVCKEGYRKVKRGRHPSGPQMKGSFGPRRCRDDRVNQLVLRVKPWYAPEAST